MNRAVEDLTHRRARRRRERSARHGRRPTPPSRRLQAAAQQGRRGLPGNVSACRSDAGRVAHSGAETNAQLLHGRRELPMPTAFQAQHPPRCPKLVTPSRALDCARRHQGDTEAAPGRHGRRPWAWSSFAGRWSSSGTISRGLDASKKLLIASLVGHHADDALRRQPVRRASPRFVRPACPACPPRTRLLPSRRSFARATAIKSTIAPGGRTGLWSAPSEQRRDHGPARRECGQMPAEHRASSSTTSSTTRAGPTRAPRTSSSTSIALQNELSRRITDWSVIRSATVVIDAPQSPRSWAPACARPTAAVDRHERPAAPP